jgi:HlyD family secretion protein
MKNSLLLLLSLLLATAACSKKEEPETEAAAPVQVALAVRDTIHRVVAADAVIFPVDQANVMSKISAPVTKFHVNRGDHVKAGQLIATLENRDLVAAVAAAKAQLAQAEANLRTVASSTVPEAETRALTDVQTAQEQVNTSQKLLESRRKLYEEGAIARKLVDEAEVAYTQAKAQLDVSREHQRIIQHTANREQIAAAQAQVEAARAQLQSAEAQLAYSEVRSPIGGIVSDRPLYPGDMASTGQPLATIVDISRVVARANVPQSQASTLKVGDPATIIVASGNLEVPGKVIVVSPATDPSSTTIQVWVESNNPKEQLKPGVTVRAEVVAQTIPSAVVVPVTALLPASEGSGAVVVTVAGNTAHIRPVTVGAREGDKVQILSGVQPGEAVVTTGGLGLEEGAKVRVVPANPAKDEAEEKK